MTRKDKAIITSILGPGKLPGRAQRVLDAAEEGGAALDDAVKLYGLAGGLYGTRLSSRYSNRRAYTVSPRRLGTATCSAEMYRAGMATSCSIWPAETFRPVDPVPVQGLLVDDDASGNQGALTEERP